MRVSKRLLCFSVLLVYGLFFPTVYGRQSGNIGEFVAASGFTSGNSGMVLDAFHLPTDMFLTGQKEREELVLFTTVLAPADHDAGRTPINVAFRTNLLYNLFLMPASCIALMTNCNAGVKMDGSIARKPESGKQNGRNDKK